jgi:hypothetical protein
MNETERIKMVKAMEFIARKINDEEIFSGWLAIGVADEDIAPGDLSIRPEDKLAGYYEDDRDFAELMGTFLHLMHRAWDEDSGLYCDGVVSDAE